LKITVTKAKFILNRSVRGIELCAPRHLHDIVSDLGCAGLMMFSVGRHLDSEALKGVKQETESSPMVIMLLEFSLIANIYAAINVAMLAICCVTQSGTRVPSCAGCMVCQASSKRTKAKLTVEIMSAGCFYNTCAFLGSLSL
jgi:hypothetical protein